MLKPKEIKFYQSVARDAAEMSHCVRLKVGAVVVKDASIMSYGYNGTPSGEDNVCEMIEYDYTPGGVFEHLVTKPTVIHAERNAINKMAGREGSAKDAIMFCTHAPCIQCAVDIHSVGFKMVIYEHDYRSTEGVEFLRSKNIPVIKINQE